MSRFGYCLKIILEHEGGYVDHKHDRGGKTNAGITQKVYDDFCRTTGRPFKHVAEITMDEVEAIYGGYWKSCKADVLPEPLDLLVFDFGVNSGPGRAIKYLQRALGVDDDGVLGQQTLAAVREEVRVGGLANLCYDYLELRREFFDKIIERDPTQAVFAKGWMNRVDHLAELTT